MKKQVPLRKTILLVTPLCVAFFVACFSCLAFSSAGSYGNYDAAVVINSDGSITGTDKIVATGNVYTFTGDIKLSDYYPAGIQVLADNVVIDGANFSLSTAGKAHIGIDLSGRAFVEIKNLEIKNFGNGIHLESSRQNKIRDCNIISDHREGGVPTGIWIFDSNKNEIIGNNVMSIKEYGILVQAASTENLLDGNRIEDNGIGIALSFCGGNILKNNQIINNNLNFQLAYNTYEQFVQDIDETNTIDGKPLIYWLDVADRVVPSDAGYVGLGNCRNILVQNLRISHNYDCISLVNTTNSVVTDCTVDSCGTGIFLKYCHDIAVTKNHLKGNLYCGIGTIASSGITISYNIIDSCAFGISTAGQTAQHAGGMGSTNMIIHNNTITACNPGVYFSLSSGITVSQNYFAQNTYGINLICGSNNSIIENTFVGSIRISGSSQNSFYHNNFIHAKPETPNYNPTYLVEMSGSNSWDNGFEGNYWSDFLDRYSGASQVDGANVWDTAYYINAENIDNHPLTSPYVASLVHPSMLPSSSIPHQQTDSESPCPNSAPSAYLFFALPLALALVCLVAVLISCKIGRGKQKQAAIA
jgi:parallel beta-helix repeat protein